MNYTNSKPLSPLIFIPLLFLIFIRPFFSDLAYPTLELYYENSIIFLAVVALVFGRAKTIGYSIPITLLLSAYIISSIFSINPQISLKESTKFISCVSIFFIVSRSNDKQKKIILKTAVLSALIISLYVIYQYFWGYRCALDYLAKINSNFLITSSYAKDILLGKRAIGTFPSPNLLGGYLIITFFLVLSFLRKQESKNLNIGILIIITLVLILTKSLGTWLSLGASLSILFLISKPHSASVHWRSMVWSSLTILVLAISFILVIRWNRLIDLENPQNSIIQRLSYWRTAMAVIKDYPILGVGPGNFQEVFLQYKIGTGTDTRYAHNIFLQMWAETGILGVVGIFWLIISFFKRFKNKVIFFSGLAFLIHNLIDNTYFISQVGIFWWILLNYFY